MSTKTLRKFRAGIESGISWLNPYLLCRMTSYGSSAENRVD